MPVPTIEWKNNRVRIIDQSVLPNRFKFVQCTSAKDVYHAIKDLIIRGAPAIGIAGAFGMYLGIRNSKAKDFTYFYKQLRKIEKYLASSRPSA